MTDEVEVEVSIEDTDGDTLELTLIDKPDMLYKWLAVEIGGDSRIFTTPKQVDNLLWHIKRLRARM